MTRQSQILEVIERYIAVHGCSPSSREIAAGAGLKSPSTVLRHLQQLKADGYVTYQPGVPRTVRVIRPARPVVPQARQAPPELDAGDSEQVVWGHFVGQVPPDMAAAHQELCLQRVAAGTATHPGIRPGDWVVIRRPAARPAPAGSSRSCARCSRRRPLPW
ncbi:MAG: hypothetical protein JO016_08860 [Actinobacteria bacterium]|nr:hypothetical protein [Actinomycetota bacterium]